MGKKDYPETVSAFTIYARNAKITEGFDLCGSTVRVPGGIAHVPPKLWSRYVPMAAKFAVEEHNKTKNAELEFVEVVRVNGQPVGGILYYITLKARDKQNNDEEKLYRAKVHKHQGPARSIVLELKVFKEDPSSLLKGPPGSQTRGQKRKADEEKKANNSSFLSFANNFRRKHPDFALMNYHKYLKLIGDHWRAMSYEEKMNYAQGDCCSLDKVSDTTGFAAGSLNKASDTTSVATGSR